MLNPQRTLSLSLALLLLSGTAACSTVPPNATPPTADTPTSPAEPTTAEAENPATPDETPPTAAPPEAAQTAANPEPSPITPSTKITTTGLGSVEIGMTIEAAEAATGQTFTQEASGGEDYGCLYYTIDGLEGVSFMVTEGTIARADITAAGVTTLSGAQVGDSAEKIRNLYPDQIESQPHEYVSGGEYLIFMPKDEASQEYQVIFETDENGVVTMIRGGRLPEVGFIEGCA